MNALVLDAGALVALERGNRDVHKDIQDVVDATVALLAKSGDRVYTSDLVDLRRLCAATGFKAVVVGC
jgi:hypothetical protein